MAGDTNLTADVVIVGSGIAGGHTAFKLAGAGVKTLVLEAGPHLSRNDAVSNFVANPEKGPNAPYPPVPYAPHPVDGKDNEFYVQAGPDQFVGSYTRILGGTTWHWTGFADRLRPADFQMRTRYGVAEDWPIRYEDLVSHYQEAENMWGVAGDPDYDWGSPRVEPYPQPPIPSSYMDQQVDVGLRKVGLHMAQFSHARNSVPFDGRPACCGNNTCVPICPIQAKYDGSVHTLKAQALGARIETKALATRIEVDADKKITGIRFRRPDGSEGLATAKIFVVACHAIETPRLLLNSKSEQTPDGVANASGNVGRYLLSQFNQDIWGLTKTPVYPYRGPQQTSGIIEFRDGDFRSKRAAVGTSFMNDGWSGNEDAVKLAGELAKKGLRGHEIISQMREQMARHLRLNCSAETLGDRNNRIDLDDKLVDSAGIPRPRVYFKVDDYTKAGLAYAVEKSKGVFAALEAEGVKTDTPYLSSAIICGTTRMGTDPKTSVVDIHLRSHDHNNLFVLGTGAHITAPVNAPTLTVAANALRAAEQILKDLGKL